MRRFSSYSSTSSPLFSPSTSPILRHHKVKRLLLNNAQTNSNGHHNLINSNNNKNKNGECDSNKNTDENKNEDNDKHENKNIRNIKVNSSEEKDDEIGGQHSNNTDFDENTKINNNTVIGVNLSSSSNASVMKEINCDINKKEETDVNNTVENKFISINESFENNIKSNIENNFENKITVKTENNSENNYKNKITNTIGINIEDNIDNILNNYMINCSPQKPNNCMRNLQKIEYEKEYEKENENVKESEKDSQKENENENEKDSQKESEKDSQKENENEKFSGTNSVECFQTYVTVAEKAYKLICLRLAISCSQTLKENDNFLIINEDSNSRCSKNVPIPLAEQILQIFKLSDLFSSNCPSLPVSTFDTLGADTMYTSRDDDVAQSSRTISTSRSESRSGSIATITLPCNVHDYRKQNSENLKSVLSIMKTLHLLVVRSWKHADILPNRLFRNKNSKNDLADLKI